MELEPGDDYLRRVAAFIRTNERNLAEAGVTSRRRVQRPSSEPPSLFNPLAWFSSDATQSTASAPPPKPLVLAADTHRLFYILMRIEALGIDVGTLDVQVDSPSRPMSYINIFPEKDKSDTMSLASFRSSLSAVSGLSLGGSWWARPEPPSVDAELKYIYSCFTKLPALLVNAPGRKGISELASDSPNRNALPLDAFKNLQSLECVDIDPRTLLGWDRLSVGLRSLKIKKSGMEDVSDILVGAVVDDQARREGSTSRKRCRKIPKGSGIEAAFYSTRLPDMVPEDMDGEEEGERPEAGSTSPLLSTQLSPSKWASLKHLSLSDNALTFFPVEPLSYLTSLTHLDLSSNLLVSVPPGLGTLFNLISLNLSDNMIDSVLGIYLNLGQVLSLNISHNRLESICGLERLTALERVDLRSNLIDESSEIGRLATLPNIADVWVEGNPFVEIEEAYRITCFDYFWKEGKTIALDGSPPGYYEKRNLTVAPPEQMSSSRPLSTAAAHSPPVVAVGQTTNSIDKYPTPPTSSNPSPHMSPVGAAGASGKVRRKKVKRIVELDGEAEITDSGSRSSSHVRNRSDGSVVKHSKTKLTPKTRKKKSREGSPLPRLVEKKWGQIGTLGDGATTSQTNDPQVEEQTREPSPSAASQQVRPEKEKANTATKKPRPQLRARHGRYQTEFIPSSSSFPEPDMQTGPPSPEMQVSTSTSPLKHSSHRGSATFSSKSQLRRARVSASVFEPPTSTSDGEDNDGNIGDDIRDSADAYRRRIEALKKDMGDGWLKVFSQSQMKSP